MSRSSCVSRHVVSGAVCRGRATTCTSESLQRCIRLVSPHILERELLLASESSLSSLLRSLQGQTQHPELRRRRRETLKGMQYSSSCCLERLCQNVGVKMNPHPPPSCVCMCVALEAFFSILKKKRANSSSSPRLFPDSPPFNEYKYDPSSFFN